LSLSNGVVSATFKKAIVTLLLKKTGLNETDLSNFWLISNLATFGKQLERVVASQITSVTTFYFQNFGQHIANIGLLKLHSLTLSMTSVILDLTSGNNTLLSLLDLSSAFDTVDHGIIRKKDSI